MSSPQYVYIPNLVGRQMLRIPVLPCDEDMSISTTIESSSPFLTLHTTATSMTTPSFSRDASPAPSVESVDEL
ncbi:hypothetical protein K505DRAFT_320909, partial [Melanomma pulvis-pyrius CBS 109.77]